MSDAPFGGLSKLGQVAINAHDIERATAFYRDVLGMKFLFPAGSLAFFDCGGVMVMLGLPEKPEFDHPASVLYFDVEDIGAAHAALTARGTAFRDTPHLVHREGERELWMAFFDDSEGNLLAIRQWRAAA